jgi:hypothetical protein
VRLTAERARRLPAEKSKSGRTFRAAIVDEPERTLNGKSRAVDGVQLFLDLCSCSGKMPSRPRQVTREALEQRGVSALAELDTHEKAVRSARAPAMTIEGDVISYREPPRPGAVLFYESMGGEVLCTVLHGCSTAEREYVARVSLDHHPIGGTRREYAAKGERIAKRTANARVVVWPSQAMQKVIRIEHEDES